MRVLIAAAVFCVSVPASAQTGRVLVMPFDVTPQSQQGPTYWMGEAAALLVADSLQARGYPVFSRAERVAAFEQLELPASAPLTRATILKVAQLVGASDVIVGALTIDGDEMAVRARSLRVDAGRALPDLAERARLRDLMTLAERLANRFAEQTLSAAKGAAVPPPPAPQ